MPADWRRFCRGEGVRLEGDEVIVEFESRRSHGVRVQEADDVLELSAVVARASACRDLPDVALRIWRHNRASQLVSFTYDATRGIRANAWIPKAGLTRDDFRFVLRRLADESDRLEYLLTGRDEH